MSSRRFIVGLSQAFLLLSISVPAAGQQWVRVSSSHFSVLTDAGRAKGHEIVAHFEQMRAMFAQLLSRNRVRMAQPLEIIAVSNPTRYAQLAPAATGSPADVPGLFLNGQDRIYVFLNAADPDCWRAIEYPFALYLLSYNYPPTPDWFNQGFAEYFASLNFTPTNAELGGDPEFPSSNQTDTSRHDEATKRGSLAEVLRNSTWLPLAGLLDTKPGTLTRRPQDQALYRAQSWVLVHYLIKGNKLSETGAYFELVENRKVPPSQAVEKAYGMSVAELDQSVKEYFHSFDSWAAGQNSANATGAKGPKPVQQLRLPLAAGDVADSATQVPVWEAQALVDEMEVRIPERREAAMERLGTLIKGDRRTDTLAAHRALAWGYLEKKDLGSAFQELNSAVQRNSSDPWTRMGLAVASYRSGENGARVQGLANMMESLHIVLTQYPEYAEAYYLLGWAQLAGGGANAALETLHKAVELSPRREDYKLRLAAAEMGAKKWDEALALLGSLQSSDAPDIAAEARKDLHDLPFLRKFGVLPADEQSSKEQASAGAQEQDESDEEPKKQTAQETTSQLDKRPIAFLKAKLISVDCSHPPEAVVVVFGRRKNLRLHIANYESLVVMGGQKFSCSWKDMPVAVNYRAGGKMDGDLVSLELE